MAKRIMSDYEIIRRMVWDDIGWKYSVKIEDENYLDDNEYSNLSEHEQQLACWKDAKEDLIDSLNDNHKYLNRETGKMEYANMYYSSYYEVGGKDACKLAASLAEKMGLHDSLAVA